MVKNKIREEMHNIRNNLHDDHVSEKSLQIIKNLTSLKEFSNAKTVMSYVSFKNEVNTKDLLKNELDKRDKKLLVPFMENDEIKVSLLNNYNDLSKGQFGILEPVKKELFNDKIDMILVPGIAFDGKGSRIGFGNGFYDKFLENHKNSLKIGLAFENQIVGSVPNEIHDKKMDMIITEKRIIRC